MSTHDSKPTDHTETETPRKGSFEEFVRDLTIVEPKSLPSVPKHITECAGCYELTPHVDRNGLCNVCSSPGQLQSWADHAGGRA